MIDYYRRVRSSGAGCMMATVCTYCYSEGLRIAFFGENPNGGVVNGPRQIDHDFGKRIWKAAQNHLLDKHGRKIVSNRNGGWKVIRIERGVK